MNIEIKIKDQTHQLTVPEIKTVTDALDTITEKELINLIQKHVIQQAKTTFKRLVDPPIKLKRLLTYNALCPLTIKKIESDPALFEPLMNAKMQEMETNNEYYTILTANTTGKDGESPRPSEEKKDSPANDHKESEAEQILTSTVRQPLS